MEGKKVVLMEQQPLSPGPLEDSESESSSASDSNVYSESVGSVNIAGCLEPKPSLDLGSPRRRNKKGDLQFLHFTKELPGIPVQKAWTFIQDLASLVPGFIERCDLVEGGGGTGSIYVTYYNPKSVKPGEDVFSINKLEVLDEESKLYVIRCVGGKYMKVYNNYVTYVNVVAHEVDGERSSAVVWRFEFDLIDPKSPTPEYTKPAYEVAMDLIMERHHAMNRVERPLVVTQAVVVNVTKRLRVAASQKRLTSADEQEAPEDMSEQRRRRKIKGKRKLKAQQTRVNDAEGTDRESRVEETRWWRQSVDFRQEDEEEGSTTGSFPFKNPDSKKTLRK